MESRAPAVVQNAADQAFEMNFEEGRAFLRYELRDKTLFLVHTEVPEALGRRGLGGKLAKAALDYARENELKVVTICPFMKSYVERHAEYQDLLFTA